MEHVSFDTTNLYNHRKFNFTEQTENTRSGLYIVFLTEQSLNLKRYEVVYEFRFLSRTFVYDSSTKFD